MLKLAAFADEISSELDANLRKEIKTKLADNGLAVIGIGSPIGKVAIDKPWQEHFDRFKIAAELAEYFAAPFIRVFSYYPAGGEGKGPIDPHRDEVMDRFRKKIEYIKDRPITLLHENEKGIFGDIG